VRLRWFVALSSVLLVVVGLTVAIYDNLDRNTEGGDQVVSDDGGDTGLPSGQVDVTSSGTLEVAGHVSALHLEDAVLQPREVATPLTISSDRGFGNGGEVVGVEVAGKPSSVVWDGGRPFVLSSGPGIRLDPVIVDLVDGEVRCALGGGAHTVLPGDYQLDTPVAVGGSGIATPRDAVAFTAGSKAAFEGRGDAALVLAKDAPHHFTGPGRVHLVGDLVVTTEQGDQVATSLDLASGPYDLTLSPTEGGGWTVSGHVQSQVVGDLKLNAQR
jgi:hypothetical protein